LEKSSYIITMDQVQRAFDEADQEEPFGAQRDVQPPMDLIKPVTYDVCYITINRAWYI